MSENPGLDSEEASAMVCRLRAAFDSGVTRSYRWRASQLEAIITLTDQNQHRIVQALHSDLSKPETEAFIHELGISCILARGERLSRIDFIKRERKHD